MFALNSVLYNTAQHAQLYYSLPFRIFAHWLSNCVAPRRTLYIVFSRVVLVLCAYVIVGVCCVVYFKIALRHFFKQKQI